MTEPVESGEHLDPLGYSDGKTDVPLLVALRDVYVAIWSSPVKVFKDLPTPILMAYMQAQDALKKAGMHPPKAIGFALREKADA